MPKTQYLDTDRLNEFIQKSGLKTGYLAEYLGLSYQGFRLKRQGVIPFRKLEIDALVSLLGMTAEAKNEIFLQKKCI